MQTMFDVKIADKKTAKFKTGFILVLLCILAIFTGQTITKNTIFDNTRSIFYENFKPNHDNSSKFELSGKYSAESPLVHIGGTPIGIAIAAEGLIVEDIGGVMTKSGEVYPTLEADLRIGDVISKVDGESVDSVYRFRMLTEDKERVELTVLRDGIKSVRHVQTALDEISGKRRLGLQLKEDVGGVGTLTFVTMDNRFAALGHYIEDSRTGLGVELCRGKIYTAFVEGVMKGEKGKAGGLLADVNRLSKPIGSISANTQIGLYGDYFLKDDSEVFPIAAVGEAQMGAAKVYTTVEGDSPKFYDVDVVKIVSQSEPAEKGMVISVRDKKLLEKTGGIVQGMSGSPIVQNGKIIGAVTHVFIQDPTRGYAVHSRFMYRYAVDTTEFEREAA